MKDGPSGLVDTLNQLFRACLMPKPGPQTTTRCSQEFKATAVHLSTRVKEVTCITAADQDRLAVRNMKQYFPQRS
jgi:hypothetical protein